MLLSHRAIVVTGLLVIHSSALPSPLSHVVAPPETPPQTTEQICGRRVDDPKSFGGSGAASFLTEFLTVHGTQNWPRNLDQNTTNTPNFVSTLDCTNLDSECLGPTVACGFFTPPEIFWIRQSIAKAHEFFNEMHTALVDSMILNTLGIDRMIADFDAGKLQDPKSILSSIGTGLSIADKLVKRSVGGDIGDTLSVIGGIFGIVSANTVAPTSDNDDLKIIVEDALSNLFLDTNNKIKDFNNKIMGGDADVDLHAFLTLVNSASGTPTIETTDAEIIAKIFSTGIFLAPQSDSDLAASVTSSVNNIKKQLVGALFKAKGFYIFIDQNRDESHCVTIPGSVFFHGECFALERPRFRNGPHRATEGVQAEFLQKMSDPAQYNIPLLQFYLSSDECKGGPLPSTLQVDDPLSGAEVINKFQPCFFSLPVVRTHGDPCLLTESKDGINLSGPLPQGLLDACSNSGGVF